jgi:hypothetical protein
MELEGSLPCSQETANNTYPERDESNPIPHPFSIANILISPSHLRTGLPFGFSD